MTDHLAIDWEHFAAVDMRVGRVLEVADFPEARVPAWKLRFDFGLPPSCFSANTPGLMNTPIVAGISPL